MEKVYLVVERDGGATVGRAIPETVGVFANEEAAEAKCRELNEDAGEGFTYHVHEWEVK